MRRFTAKILILFSTFFIGIAAYYFYSFSPAAPVAEIQNLPAIPNAAPAPVLNNLEEKPAENNFYNVSPCQEANFLKQYLEPARGTISAGIVNHRVLCGNSHEPFRNTENISGVVMVSVLIDQYGEVENARILNGHRLLNKSALRAARQARFAPYLLGGEPVKVRGVLIYEFAADGKAGLQKIRKPL